MYRRSVRTDTSAKAAPAAGLTSRSVEPGCPPCRLRDPLPRRPPLALPKVRPRPHMSEQGVTYFIRTYSTSPAAPNCGNALEDDVNRAPMPALGHPQNALRA